MPKPNNRRSRMEFDQAMRYLMILSPLVLGGCAMDAARAIGMLTRRAPSDLNIPLVHATEQSTSSLSVTTCFIGPNGHQGLELMLQTLTNHGILVKAEDGGNARLTLNACPPTVDADLVRAAGEVTRAANETRRRGVVRP